MIKFFRHIRKKLLSENKFSKYLIYAVGEIVLVVIGILIALWISNKNEEHKETQELNNYLLKISNDVQRDIQQVESLKNRRDKVRLDALNTYKHLIVRDYKEEEEIREGYSVFYEFYFIPNKSGFEAIKSSSYLGKINNTRLDSLLNQYHAYVDNTVNRENGFNGFIERMEATMKSEINILPHQSILNAKFHPNLLQEDSTSTELVSDIPTRLIPMFENNSFRAAIGRVVSDATYEKDYQTIMETGTHLIHEIQLRIKKP